MVAAPLGSNPSQPTSNVVSEAVSKLVNVFSQVLERQNVTESELEQTKAELAQHLQLEQANAQEINDLVDKLAAATPGTPAA